MSLQFLQVLLLLGQGLGRDRAETGWDLPGSRFLLFLAPRCPNLGGDWAGSVQQACCIHSLPPAAPMHRNADGVGDTARAWTSDWIFVRRLHRARPAAIFSITSWKKCNHINAKRVLVGTPPEYQQSDRNKTNI